MRLRTLSLGPIPAVLQASSAALFRPFSTFIFEHLPSPPPAVVHVTLFLLASAFTALTMPPSPPPPGICEARGRVEHNERRKKEQEARQEARRKRQEEREKRAQGATGVAGGDDASDTQGVILIAAE